MQESEDMAGLLQEGAAPPIKQLTAKQMSQAASTFFSKLQVVMAVPTSSKLP